jgi:hypothetical protein
MSLKSADTRHNASRPDGYMLVKDRLQGRLYHVVLSCEYKRKEGDENLDDAVMYLGF